MDDQRSKIVEDRLLLQIKENNEKIKNLRTEIEKKYPRYAELTSGRFVPLNQLQSYLDPEEAVALFLLGNQASYLQLITKKDIHIVQIPLTQDQIGEDVRSLRKALDAQQGSVSEFDLNKSHSLYESIFGKVTDFIKDKKHLIVVPTGPLASLPFSILVTQAPKSKEYSEADWFVRKVAISHAPSLASFYDQRSTTPIKPASLPFLGFGNPVLAPIKKATPTSMVSVVKPTDKNSPPLPPTSIELCRESGPIPTEVLLAMPSLPDTANELQQIGKIMSVGQTPALYLGAQATEDNLRKLQLDEYRVLYFATHGLLPGELRCQSEPGLVLTPPSKIEKDTLKSQDGLVDASEIAQFKLNADLVVLSACNTAGGNGKFGGEALSGLAEAFFYAGARNLLVTHWSVSSAATVQLMQKTFSLLGPKLEGGASMALQQAQLQMVAKPEFAHPIFWGAFDLVGDGAPEGVGSTRQLVSNPTTSSNAM
jgi:CHAT domain-containing protein